MGEIMKNAVFHNTPFWVLTITAIVLLVVAFILPPTAVIDKSVLMAVGELMGFGALWTVVKAIDKGTTARVKHNNTEISVEEQKK